MFTNTMIRACLLGALTAMTGAPAAHAAGLQYAGADYDIGGTFFPGAGPQGNPNQPYVVVPWRTSGVGNQFAAVDEDGERYYGRDGYALFGTRHDYPSAYVAPGSSASPGDPIFESLFPNLIEMPDFISDQQVLASRIVGGYGYALIDDPTLTSGIRDWAWGESQSPQSFGQPPYVQLGILDGWDQFGNDPANADSLPAGRWGFRVGAGSPDHFRVGVMVDGTDNSDFVPEEIVLAQVSAFGGGSIVGSASSLTTESNRFVDMHFFDITGAQEGDFFAVGVKARDGEVSYGNSGVSGFTIDVLPEAPALAGDYNGNGTVDAADFTVWRDNETLTVTPGTMGDGNLDGVVGDEDYNIWASNFGNTIASTITPPGASLSVPEPGAGVLLLASVLGCSSRRKRSV
ncbi:hypothetical protein Mal64_34950 [Pseudobythopirellula maris]|uniref:PEP-CTERM protein-sorting domain-containing protein n=1 Tax=Pseudobythopirellula maris TaxID=2527991 RepID=A0A5C5ZHH9_9BACT|nr:PEP-CTERM sorting domain-containing protein [Pseudobythopirellula maris]TWT86666.1 hypothetical protein Mal64_34950 [Pseudobythopirellula maris]